MSRICSLDLCFMLRSIPTKRPLQQPVWHALWIFLQPQWRPHVGLCFPFFSWHTVCKLFWILDRVTIPSPIHVRLFVCLYVCVCVKSGITPVQRNNACLFRETYSIISGYTHFCFSWRRGKLLILFDDKENLQRHLKPIFPFSLNS